MPPTLTWRSWQGEEAAIIEYPMKAGQEELIQREIGVINPIGVGQINAQIDAREDREYIVQRILTEVKIKKKRLR